MSILDWLNKKEKRGFGAEKRQVPDDLWVKCHQCSETVYLRDLQKNCMVCPCDKQCHFRISPEERIEFIFDENSFVESHADIRPVDALNFKDTEAYTDRLDRAQSKTKHADAIITGVAELHRKPVNLAIMDFGFMGGSMGSVVGEKITRIVEDAIDNKYPVIIFTSSGGARMQEGILSLMQMAKTSAALARLADASIPYISVLCDPTTGGTSASFAMLGDINLAEPGALISFAGPRVIEQTIRQKLPKGFQRAEFLLEHGMLDKVVPRPEMRKTLGDMIRILDPHGKSRS